MQELNKGEITVTEEAAKYLKGVAGENQAIRLSVRAGKGCGGHDYHMEPMPKVDDSAPDFYLRAGDDLRLILPPGDLLKLFGTTIDYIEDELGNCRVVITNPNETGRCGCGLSPTF
jgi:iron-sulfur cluster assembly accessory protein